jgi:outer membrane assembly lipoprotein YfgL
MTLASMRWSSRALLLASAVALAGCSLFSDKPKPAPLEAITPKLAGAQVWSAHLDDVKFPVEVAVSGGSFTVADSNGTVLVLNAADGRELWRGQAGAKLSAGVGSDGRSAAVVTRDNELVVLNAQGVQWRHALKSRVATAPLVAGERVFVMGVDRAVHAFDEKDGRYLWVYDHPGDALTLAEPGVLAAYKDTLVVGQGPRLTGLDPLRGTERWEAAIASPRGTNEIERLADLVGPATRNGSVICTRAFQASVGCVDAERGALLWSKNIGGIRAIGADADYVTAADATDHLTAWHASNGESVWSNEHFLNRSLSGVLNTGKAVVFGDFEGQVSFLARDTGQTLLRLPTDGSQVVATPALAADGTILVVTRKGGLFAFRLQ